MNGAGGPVEALWERIEDVAATLPAALDGLVVPPNVTTDHHQRHLLRSGSGQRMCGGLRMAATGPRVVEQQHGLAGQVGDRSVAIRVELAPLHLARRLERPPQALLDRFDPAGQLCKGGMLVPLRLARWNDRDEIEAVRAGCTGDARLVVS